MSRRAALATALVIAGGSACRSGASEAQQFDGAQAHRWVVYQVAAGPRIPNTPGHRAIGDWLVSELKRRADTVIVQEWVHVSLQGDSLHLRNIFARFKPSDPNRVLYVSHWDSRPVSDMDPDPAKRNLPMPGAEDGGSSTALLLGVADALKKQPPALGVDLLFVDGEDYGSFDDPGTPDVMIGARYFAHHMPPGYQPVFGVLFDMVGDFTQEFYQEENSLQFAPEVVDRVWSTAERLGLGRVFRNAEIGAITDDHVPLHEAGIRIIDVIDCCATLGDPAHSPYPWWHTTQDTPDKVSPQALTNVGRVALALVH
ncbi:MAG: M28 family peptidase [Gemmatimonadales bacterium]